MMAETDVPHELRIGRSASGGVTSHSPRRSFSSGYGRNWPGEALQTSIYSPKTGHSTGAEDALPIEIG